jgi:UDP-N-acetylglucosamine 2-epimerase
MLVTGHRKFWRECSTFAEALLEISERDDVTIISVHLNPNVKVCVNYCLTGIIFYLNPVSYRCLVNAIF